MDTDHPDIYGLLVRHFPEEPYQMMSATGGDTPEEAVKRAMERWPGDPFVVVRWSYEWCGYMWEDIATGIARDPCYEP